MEVSLDYRRVLIPVDFTDVSRKSFYLALKLARMFDADTYVLHVRTPMDSFDGNDTVETHASELERMEEGVRRRVNELFDKGGLQEVDRRKVHIDFAGGDPAKEILRYAVDNDVDIIVMGLSPKSGIKQIFKPSPAEKVARKAPCHVLLIKPDGYEYVPENIPDKYKV